MELFLYVIHLSRRFTLFINEDMMELPHYYSDPSSTLVPQRPFSSPSHSLFLGGMIMPSIRLDRFTSSLGTQLSRRVALQAGVGLGGLAVTRASTAAQEATPAASPVAG